MKQWEAVLEDGEIVKEEDINWDLIKDKVELLTFNNNGQIISLPPSLKYVQAKTASMSFNSKEIVIESRYIGVIKNNLKFLVRVDEKTNNISIEIYEIRDPKNLLNS